MYSNQCRSGREISTYPRRNSRLQYVVFDSDMCVYAIWDLNPILYHPKHNSYTSSQVLHTSKIHHNDELDRLKIPR
jgi:hypothetical protein